jgi:hypothetical protein
MADGRRTMILTWNPDKFWWGDGYFDAIEQTAQGEAVPVSWSTGGRKGGVSKGDRVFMLRQGTQGKGMVASGTVVSEIYQDRGWAGSGGLANYVDVLFEDVVSVEDALPTEVLKRQLPQTNWDRLQMSGTLLKTELVRLLEETWSNHLTALGRQSDNGQSQGQTPLMDAVRRKKIEDAAQNRLMEHYRRRGWRVTDTRDGNPFDAVAQRSGPWVVSTCGVVGPSGPDGDEVLYLEAKGTQSAGSAVLVTRGEVEHARANTGRCVMGIWSEIEFDGDGEVDVVSGSFQVIPFEPCDHELTAVSYQWRVPDTPVWTDTDIC